jgi:cytochrome c-type biogenesis protein CcmH/NrfG
MMDSRSPEISLWVGRSYMAMGRADEAIVVLRQALERHPRDYRLISAYADCSDMLGRKEVVAEMLVRIREVLMETLERTPDDTYGRSVLAIALAQSGDTAAGVAQAERALADAHEDGRVLYCAACAFTYAGLHARALEQLRGMLAAYPGFLREWARHDPDLAPLRGLPEFVEMFGPA